eukprot:Skav232798  [mRNA]  locus=scaffold614:310286:310642:+ [translate_table: standard]
MVYAGPVADVKPYFVSCGFPFPEESISEQGYSLPDWLVDTTSGATGSLADPTDIENRETTADFATLWAKSNVSEAYTKDFPTDLCCKL